MSAPIELLTAAELAARLSVRPATIRVWARAGMIPAVRLTPKVVRFEPGDVLAALRRFQRPSCHGCGEVADE
jgi:predicted site-specific integrase-resolvase